VDLAGWLHGSTVAVVVGLVGGLYGRRPPDPAPTARRTSRARRPSGTRASRPWRWTSTRPRRRPTRPGNAEDGGDGARV